MTWKIKNSYDLPLRRSSLFSFAACHPSNSSLARCRCSVNRMNPHQAFHRSLFSNQSLFHKKKENSPTNAERKEITSPEPDNNVRIIIPALGYRGRGEKSNSAAALLAGSPALLYFKKKKDEAMPFQIRARDDDGREIRLCRFKRKCQALLLMDGFGNGSRSEKAWEKIARSGSLAEKWFRSWRIGLPLVVLWRMIGFVVGSN